MAKGHKEAITGFVAEDLFEFRLCAKSVLSPDGQKIIVPVQRIDREKNKYFSNLWLIDCESREHFSFTYGEFTDTQPVWSPDGRFIVFVSDRGKEPQLWKIRVDGGEAQPLTKMPRGIITDPVWSPDGEWIAFLFQKRGHIGQAPVPEQSGSDETNGHSDRKTNADPVDYEKFDKDEMRRPKHIRKLIYKADGAGLLTEENMHLWLINVQTGETRQLTNGPFDEVMPVWFPDSSALLYCSNRSADPEYEPMRIDLWLSTIKDGRTEKIITQEGPSFLPAISPDGKSIAFVGHNIPDLFWASASNHLWLLKRESGELTNLTQKQDRSLGNEISADLQFMDRDTSPHWSPDGKGIYYCASDAGACHLFYYDVTGECSRQITRGPLETRSFSFSDNGQRAALTIADLSHPGDVYLYTFGKNVKQQRITEFNREILKSRAVSKPEEIWFENEGTRLQGWLMKPVTFSNRKKYPLIIEIHGGPHILYGYNFFFEFQYLVSKGFLVFYMNPRGSQGYGAEFTRAILKDWGGPDYRDIMHTIDELSKRPFVDKSRLGITGGSYGGFMTNWAIGHTDIFAAAVTQRSVTNLESLFGTSDVVHSVQGVWGCFPWENRYLFAKLSPLSYVHNIRMPLLIIHSEADFRCPIEQAEQLYISLKHLRQTVEFVRFPQESHELSRSGAPDHRIARLKKISDWFEQYLLAKDGKK